MLSASTIGVSNARYDHPMPRRSETAAEVAERLDAGEALGVGQIAILTGMSRGAVDYWLVDGLQVPDTGERWIPRQSFTAGGHRRVPADQVQRILDLVRSRQPRQPRNPRRRPPVEQQP